MAKTHLRTEITVQGKGPFPIDMLRYDDCTPATEVNARHIQRSYEREAWKEATQIELHRFSFDGRKATTARWASFGWKVIADSGRAC
mgnify:CR=1 FL=1